MSSNIPFRADIEGLRGIAILLVVGYHAGVPYMEGGYIGVDVFFVLSGFLITQLLVKEAERSGKIDLTSFYARRVRRLLPAAFVLLLGVIAVSAVIYAPLEQSRYLSMTALSAAAYLSNIYFAYAALDYHGASASENPLLHTWSLSVEEQFYLVWPLIVALSLGTSIGKKRNGGLDYRRLVMTLVLVCGASFAAAVWLTTRAQPWAFFLSPARAWEFAIGGITALFTQYSLKYRWAEGLALVGMALVLGPALVYDESTTFPGIAALVPCVGTAIVIYVGEKNSRSRIASVLSTRALRELGRLSYSWYLWHWPVVVFAKVAFGDLDLLWRLACVIISLMVAEASYRYIEQPIRYHGTLARRPATALLVGIAITCAAVGAAWSWRSWAGVMARRGDHGKFYSVRHDLNTTTECDSRDAFDYTLRPCTHGNRAGSPRIY